MKNIKYIVLYFSLVLLFACQQPGKNSTGSEYMPDMGHSVAYEANYYNYYYHNTWGSEDDYYKMVTPKLPVAGTVPRRTTNGDPVYHYGNSEEERARAMAEIINNPYPITDAGLAAAKPLYDIYCGICHGDKGDGNGYLVRDGSPYPVQPANFLLEEFLNASNGRYYHTIMQGRNLMGAYADKLSYEERWQVIHYIRSLQAKELKLAYNEEINTLNNIAVPAASLVDAMAKEEMSHHGSDDHHGADGHHVTDDQDHSH